jgi:hypothetical protein
MKKTFDVTIVLTITADDELEVEDLLRDSYELDVENPPDWGAIVIKELTD